MIRVGLLLAVLGVLCGLGWSPALARPGEEGRALFQEKCVACHTIGRGVLVGPDLQGVAERRDESWLKVHIQSPSVHHAQNDPITVANVEKFRMRMPDLGLTPQQVEAVIAHLKTAGTASAAIPAQYAPTLAIAGLAIAGLTIIALLVGRKRVEVRG